MVPSNLITTPFDKVLHDIYLKSDDASLAHYINFVSDACERTFPLTDESLAGVCIFSLLGVVCHLQDNEMSREAFMVFRDILQDILSTPLFVVPEMPRNILADRYLHHWDSFIAKAVDIKGRFGVSKEYYNALVDDITARATRIRIHYGAIELDCIYASL